MAPLARSSSDAKTAQDAGSGAVTNVSWLAHQCASLSSIPTHHNAPMLLLLLLLLPPQAHTRPKAKKW
jgi:hypothetical protein